MKNKSAAKVEMNPYDDLFETDESRADKNLERIFKIPIQDIMDFPEHPYYVKDDDSMFELVSSIKEEGILTPVLVRPLEDGKYEMISGHRRKRACEIAGITEIDARVMDLTRDEAVLMMVDSNLQREEVLPSEKARAYKMRLEALKRQGKRTDLTCGPMDHKLEIGKKSRDYLAEEFNESPRQISRFIRLNELIPELLELVDEKRIALRPAVEISYLPEEAQYNLLDAIEINEATPSHAQAIKMRKFYSDGKLTKEVIESIMCEEKPNQREKSAIRDPRIIKAIPQSVPREKQCDYVIKAVEYYNRVLERKRRESER